MLMIREGVDATILEGVAAAPPVASLPRELRALRATRPALDGVVPRAPQGTSGVLGQSTPLLKAPSGDLCRSTSAGDAKLFAKPIGGVPCTSSSHVNNSGLCATNGLLPLARRTRWLRAGVPRKSRVAFDGVFRFNIAGLRLSRSGLPMPWLI